VSAILIRKSSISDRAELARTTELIFSIFPNAKLKISKNDLVLVAERDGIFIGFIHFITRKGKLILQGIGVKEEFRGEGIGKNLISAALDLLPKDQPVYLKVKASNDPAIALYFKSGFVQKKYGDILVMAREPEN